jgi:cation:H+ antiporter
MHPLLAVFVGLGLAALGGELFVGGAVGLARWARVPAGIIGATIAAFATSSPELSVAISSAQAGAPQIALGDALGSNVVNIGLVLGLALLIGPLRASTDMVKRELVLTLLVPLGTLVLLLDGELSRLDGAGMLAVFAVWLVAVTLAAVRDRVEDDESVVRPSLALGKSVAGLICLVLAGSYIVQGAKFIGAELGWSQFVVGATLVALGTSIPELATTIMSRLRGHDDVGLGALLGSNVFNGLFIVGVVACMRPFQVQPIDVSTGILFGWVTLLVVIPPRNGVLAKWRGWALLALYAGYVVLLTRLAPE